MELFEWTNCIKVGSLPVSVFRHAPHTVDLRWYQRETELNERISLLQKVSDIKSNLLFMHVYDIQETDHLDNFTK